MSTIVEPMMCTACGCEAEPTPAVLAAGGSHSRCVVPERLSAALTASASASGADAWVLARWTLRQALAANHRRSECARALGNGATTDIRDPDDSIIERRLPHRIVRVVRMLAFAGDAGEHPVAADLQADVARLIGRQAAADAWKTLTTARVLRVSSRPFERTIITKIDREAWSELLADLLSQEREARR